MRPGTVMIVLTVLVCLTAILLRTPIRSRYWAWQITRTGSTAERAVYVTLLCNAGTGGRWGAAALLDHGDPEIRQFGVVVLHHTRGAWARGRLLQLLGDPDDTVRELAAVGLAIQADESVIPELKRMYSSGEQPAASAACIALGRIATPKAVSALAELVAQAADVVRRAALVDALGEIGTPQCVPPLLELLEDHRACDVPTRAARLALAALRGLQAEAALPLASLPAVLLRSPAPTSRPAAVLLPGTLPASDGKGGWQVSKTRPGLQTRPGLRGGWQVSKTRPALQTTTGRSRRLDLPYRLQTRPGLRADGELGTIAERAAAALARITGVNPPFASDLPPEQREQARRQWSDWHASRTAAPQP